MEVIKRIPLESPHARIIVLTTFEDDEDLPCALEAGAQTYLLNAMAADELVATILAVHAGALQALNPVELASRPQTKPTRNGAHTFNVFATSMEKHKRERLQ